MENFFKLHRMTIHATSNKIKIIGQTKGRMTVLAYIEGEKKALGTVFPAIQARALGLVFSDKEGEK